MDGFSLIELLMLLFVSGFCGGIAESIVGFTRGGCLVSMFFGFIGAMVGPRIANALGLPEMLAIDISGTHFPIIWSIIGAVVVIALVSLFTGKKEDD